MTANVRIVTDQRKDVLACRSRRCASSRTAPRDGDRHAARTGAKQVWVMRDGAPVAWPSRSASTTASRSEITSGELAAGDAVIVDRAGERDRGSAPRRSPFAF